MVHITEGRILFNSDPSIHNVSEAGQSNVGHASVLEYGECVELDQLVASDYRQLGEDASEGDDLIGPVEEDKVSHLWNSINTRE